LQPRRNPDRTYGDKLIALFARLLFHRRRYSLTELADMLDCSKQTVLRLVDDIAQAYGVTIRSELGSDRRRWFWIEGVPKSPPAALLSEAELRTLQMCRDFTRHLLGTRTWQDLERAVVKSARFLPADAQPDDLAFGVVRTGVIDYTEHENILRVLLDGLQQRRVCEVSYRSLEARRAKTFRIKPLQVFAHRESVYVHARLARMPGKLYRVPRYDPLLALHRFTRAVLTDTPFRRPKGYDFEKVMNRGYGVWLQRRFRVKLELTGWAATFAAERTWSPDQRLRWRGDTLELSFWSTSEPEVVSLVLSFGRHARLLEPAGLRDTVTAELDAARTAYR